MLKTLREVLQMAENGNYAVGAFNSPNMESLEAIVEAAEELKLPVIMQFAQCHEPWIPLSKIGPVMVEAAKKSTIPICVHLDHGETIEYLKEALDIGFSSVMFDGSTLPYDENVRLTAETVKIASSYGASVEAELGSMGGRESGDGKADENSAKIYTDPDLAEEFIKTTHIDALACSFGTTHGLYLSSPKLDFGIVKEVRKKTNNIPVVMHGGSGVSEEAFRSAIESGVRKINYFTYMDKAGGARIKEWILSGNEPIFFSDIVREARKAMKDDIARAMKIFTANKQV